MGIVSNYVKAFHQFLWDSDMLKENQIMIHIPCVGDPIFRTIWLGTGGVFPLFAAVVDVDSAGGGMVIIINVFRHCLMAQHSLVRKCPRLKMTLKSTNLHPFWNTRL